MELLECPSEYLIVDGVHCLRCSRITGRLEAADELAVAEQLDPSCLGIIYGVIGRVEFTSHGPSYLILIKERNRVGSHPSTGDPIYKMEKVTAIPLAPSDATNDDSNAKLDLDLPACPKHHPSYTTLNGDSTKLMKPGVGGVGISLLQKGQKKMVKATTDSLKFVTNKMNIGGLSAGNKLNHGQSDIRDRIRTERRFVLEFLRMFNEGGSFYYCPNGDITNSVQRLTENGTWSKVDAFDHRFVWNSYMLRDLIKQQSESISAASRWIVPIIQGYVGVEDCSVMLGNQWDQSDVKSRHPIRDTFQFRLMLISRRSVHRAGTRYIKRGIDADGHCANYVETEQIVVVGGEYGDHSAAFVQVRGSVPVYWSQPGYKYKPPPKLDKPKSESVQAFRKHFDEEFRLYSNVVVVNLVEQIGKERVLSDAYIDHVLDSDWDNITYVGFDFHEHCRGLKFENVALLISTLQDNLTQNGFSWVDRGVPNCTQNGVFRVNCVDCLDRTNVVQAALGRAMLEIQLRKFGVLPPEESLPASCLRPFQLLWAANGDAISRQYAGTVALKGDYTRTGQRNLAGMMKDGYNSANRYYLCHMKDARRQAAIDALLGNQTLDTDQELEQMLKSKLEAAGVEDEAEWLKEKDEQLRLFVRDCERLVVPEGEVILGGWAFINADPGVADETEEEMNTCVILTRQAYYVADYDEDLDKFVDFQRVQLQDLLKIEAGPMTVASVLGVPKAKATCLRIYYKADNGGENEYFHVWRSGSTRLFNNLAIAIKNSEEADEYMKAVAEQFRVAIELMGMSIDVIHPLKLERKRSKLPPSKLALRQQTLGYDTAPVFFTSLTTSVSGGMKSFGSRVSSAFGYHRNSGIKLFRMGTGRRQDALASNGVKDPPLLTFQDTTNISNMEWRTDHVVNPQVGLLFGAGTIADTARSTVPTTLRKSKSQELPNSDSSRPESARRSKFEIFSTPSRPASSAAKVGSILAGPATVVSPSFLSPSLDSHQIMKTSHSETSFKPLSKESSEGGSIPRALAVSQNALDKTEKDNSRTNTVGLKFPMLFKRKMEDGTEGRQGERKKFVQFMERLEKSRTRFILL